MKYLYFGANLAMDYQKIWSCGSELGELIWSQSYKIKQALKKRKRERKRERERERERES